MLGFVKFFQHVEIYCSGRNISWKFKKLVYTHFIYRVVFFLYYLSILVICNLSIIYAGWASRTWVVTILMHFEERWCRTRCSKRLWITQSWKISRKIFGFFEQFQLNLMLRKFIIDYVWCLLVNFNSEIKTPQLVLFLLGLSQINFLLLIHCLGKIIK